MTTTSKECESGAEQILHANRNATQIPRSPSVSSVNVLGRHLSDDGTPEWPEPKALPNGLAQVASFDIALLQKRSRPGSLILPSERNARLTSSPSRPCRARRHHRPQNRHPPTAADALDYDCESVGLHNRAARHEIFTPRVTSAGSRNGNGAPACQFILRARQGTQHLANDLLEEVTKGNAKRRQTINREGPRGLPRGHDHELAPAGRGVHSNPCKSPIRNLRVRRPGGGLTSFKGKVMSANLNYRQEKFAQNLAKGMSKANPTSRPAISRIRATRPA